MFSHVPLPPRTVNEIIPYALLCSVYFHSTLCCVRLPWSINNDMQYLFTMVHNVCALVRIYLVVVAHLGCFLFVDVIPMPQKTCKVYTFA